MSRGLASIELAAATELACAVLDWQRNGVSFARTIDRWSAENEVLAMARHALEQGDVPFVENFAAPTVEVRAAPSRAEFTADGRWPLFLQRFDRGLRQVCRLQSAIS